MRRRLILILFSCISIAEGALDFVLPKYYKNWSQCDIGTPFSTDKLTEAGAYLQIFTTMRAQCDGYISEWWIYK